MDKVVFLDRDGTIIVDKGYVHKKKDLEFLPNAVKGMKKLQNSGYRLIIASNQSGIGRGYFSKEDYFDFRHYMDEKLRKNKVSITAEYFCPHVPEDNCDCRKPRIGMLEKAARIFNLNLRECWMIGDSERDIQAGKSAGCRTIQILIGEEKTSLILPDFTARDLLEAADYILGNKNK